MSSQMMINLELSHPKQGQSYGKLQILKTNFPCTELIRNDQNVIYLDGILLLNFYYFLLVKNFISITSV